MGMIITATPVFRCRRIEAGLLSAGQDFTNKTDPYSVGLGRFIDIDKENFIGKEALQKSDKECRTWGIRVEKGTAIKGKNLKIKVIFVQKQFGLLIAQKISKMIGASVQEIDPLSENYLENMRQTAKAISRANH